MARFVTRPIPNANSKAISVPSMSNLRLDALPRS